MGAPVDFTLAMRVVLLSFVRLVQKNKFIYECAPGTEAQSIDWDWIVRFLTQHGKDRMIFGDFQNYDMSMRAPLVLAAFGLIADFHEKVGCHPDHCKMIRGIGQDIAFALVDFHGDLIEVFGKNPSGQALTVIINGIVNCLYMRYCYLKCNPAKEVETFDDNVALITYGDDNGMGVSPKTPWFNHTTIMKTLASIDVVYTMAEKGEESRPYISIDEGSFLKRKWRWEDEVNAYVGPLDVESIHKMLQIGVSPNYLTPEQHMIEKCRSANDEWFWHGRSVFEKWRECLLGLVQKHDLNVYLETQPLATWEQLKKRYLDNSDRFRNAVVAPPFVYEGPLRSDNVSFQGLAEPTPLGTFLILFMTTIFCCCFVVNTYMLLWERNGHFFFFSTLCLTTIMTIFYDQAWYMMTGIDMHNPQRDYMKTQLPSLGSW